MRDGRRGAGPAAGRRRALRVAEHAERRNGLEEGDGLGPPAGPPGRGDGRRLTGPALRVRLDRPVHAVTARGLAHVGERPLVALRIAEGRVEERTLRRAETLGGEQGADGVTAAAGADVGGGGLARGGRVAEQVEPVVAEGVGDTSAVA